MSKILLTSFVNDPICAFGVLLYLLGWLAQLVSVQVISAHETQGFEFDSRVIQ